MSDHGFHDDVTEELLKGVFDDGVDRAGATFESIDHDHDGVDDRFEVDLQGDGHPDAVAFDDDNDGVIDRVEDGHGHELAVADQQDLVWDLGAAARDMTSAQFKGAVEWASAVVVRREALVADFARMGVDRDHVDDALRWINAAEQHRQAEAAAEAAREAAEAAEHARAHGPIDLGAPAEPVHASEPAAAMPAPAPLPPAVQTAAAGLVEPNDPNVDWQGPPDTIEEAVGSLAVAPPSQPLLVGGIDVNPFTSTGTTGLLHSILHTPLPGSDGPSTNGGGIPGIVGITANAFTTAQNTSSVTGITTIGAPASEIGWP
jgi:hypothetical protein